MSLWSVVLLFIACDLTPSLQKYIVESKENNEYIAIDLPASIISLNETEVSEEIKATLATIKKMNFIALQITDTNKALFESEKQKVKTILKNPEYKELIKVNNNGTNIVVCYLGKEEAINEVVIFGSDNKKGLAVVRVLGENMNPADIFKISQVINIDSNSTQVKALKGILGGFK